MTSLFRQIKGTKKQCGCNYRNGSRQKRKRIAENILVPWMRNLLKKTTKKLLQIEKCFWSQISRENLRLLMKLFHAHTIYSQSYIVWQQTRTKFTRFFLFCRPQELEPYEIIYYDWKFIRHENLSCNHCFTTLEVKFIYTKI